MSFLVQNDQKYYNIFLCEEFSEKAPGLPRPHFGNTRGSPGNLGAFSDFFQKSNEKLTKMDKKGFVG